MARVKRGKIKIKKRKRLLKLAKGYKWGRKSKKKLAREAILHAYKHAYEGRKERKRRFRKLWNVRINALVRNYGLSYGQFIHLLKEKNIKLNRKVISEIGNQFPQVFEKLVNEVKNR